jgi:hypothetical protein
VYSEKVEAMLKFTNFAEMVSTETARIPPPPKTQALRARRAPDCI